MEQTHVTVRRSRPADLDGFETFVATLSIETSTRRFFTPTNRLPRSSSRILLVNDPKRGSFLAWDGDRVVAHGCWAAVSIDSAELAVVVADGAQRHGVGRRLTRTLLQDMYDAGIRQTEMVVEPENRPVIDLIRRSWPDARPRMEDGLLTFVTPTAAQEASRAVA